MEGRTIISESHISFSLLFPKEELHNPSRLSHVPCYPIPPPYSTFTTPVIAHNPPRIPTSPKDSTTYRKTTTSPLLTFHFLPFHIHTPTTSFLALVFQSVFRKGYIDGPVTRMRVKMWCWMNQMGVIRVRSVSMGKRMRGRRVRKRVWRVERRWMRGRRFWWRRSRRRGERRRGEWVKDRKEGERAIWRVRNARGIGRMVGRL